MRWISLVVASGALAAAVWAPVAHAGADVCVEPAVNGYCPTSSKAPLRLTVAQAKADANIALGRRFGDSYKIAYHPKLHGCVRRSQSRARCDAGWTIGDASWAGPITIWLTSTAAGGYVWNYSYTIKRYDVYCLSVAPKVNCVRTFRVAHGYEYERL